MAAIARVADATGRAPATLAILLLVATNVIATMLAAEFVASQC